MARVFTRAKKQERVFTRTTQNTEYGPNMARVFTRAKKQERVFTRTTQNTEYGASIHSQRFD